MKSKESLASLTALSVLNFALACSSSNSNAGSDAGNAGGKNPAGGSANGGSAGNATGGTSGSPTGGSAGNASGGGGGAGTAGSGGGTPANTEGGVSSGGTSAVDGGDAGTATGGTGNCQADLQTDPQNCGRCGKSCAGGDCDQGLCTPVLVLDTQEEPYGPFVYQWSTFVDQGKVYLWEKTTRNANHFLVLSTSTTPKNPAAVGDVVQDVAFPPDIDSVAFDSTFIYEATLGANVGSGAHVSTKKLSDPSTVLAAKLFRLPAGPPDPNNGNGPSDLLWQNIALASDAIYLTGTTQINGFFHPTPDTTSIYRIAVPVTDATKQPAPIIGGRGEVVSDLVVFGNATTGKHLFWLEYDRSRKDSDAGSGSDYFVFTAPAAGGTPILLGDANTSDGAFASDGTYVYWTEHNDLGRLMRCPLGHLGDASQVQRVADVASAMEGIVAQGQYVYVMETNDPRPVYRVNTANGNRDLLGNGEIPPAEKETRLIGADANFLYMAGLDGKVWRLPIVP